MSYIGVGCAIMFAIAIALWRRAPLLFMVAGGMTIIGACYMADILNGGVTNNLSITASVLMILLSFTFIAYAFVMLFTSEEKRER